MTLVAPSVSYYLDMAPDARSRAIDATSTDPWGPSRALMEDLRADMLTRHCADVLHILHEALLSRGPQWRRILKALTTITYCLRHGSNEVACFALAHRSLISQLTQFEHFDVYGLDRGAAVRAEACGVADMLQMGATAGPSTISYPQTTSRHRPDPPPAPPRATSQVRLFPISPSEELALPEERDDVQSETDRLTHLVLRLDASPDDEHTLLNTYKLLFLVHNALPTAPDADIRHWSQHTLLFARLAHRRPVSAPESVAPEVRRLAAELADLFEGHARPSEVRRRARMF